METRPPKTRKEFFHASMRVGHAALRALSRCDTRDRKGMIKAAREMARVATQAADTEAQVVRARLLMEQVKNF